jgi:hypothetical protein
MSQTKRKALAREERGLSPARLGELAAQGLGVFCWCNRCFHNSVLDSAALLPELGPDFPVPELGARLRCSACQSKDIATRPDWPGLGQVTRALPQQLSEEKDENSVSEETTA